MARLIDFSQKSRERTIMASPEEFKISIDKWVHGADRKGEEFASTFCLELASEIQENTPVKTGNLKSQWRASINGEASDIEEGTTAEEAVSGLRVGDSFFFTNHAAYAIYVEYGTRPHDIYPRGLPDGALALHWKSGGQDIFAQHVWHPGTEGQAFVMSVIARADDIAQSVANRLGTSDSNLITGS